jgi:uncharacterized protein
MRLNEVVFDGRVPIDGYGPGFFRIGGAVFEGPLAMLPGGPRRWAGLPDVAAFLERPDEFDVLLMGMGAEIAPLPVEARARLEESGVAVEIMGTPSACRTYNVLLGEGRRIAAALIPA